jgi:hypothetical protein
MTTYTTLSNALVGVGAKPFATTIQALRDNPLAIAEGDATAPKIAFAAIVDGVAGASEGGVGTYAFARPSTTASYAFGATLAGSSLQPTAAFTSDEDPFGKNSTSTFSMILGAALSGTWRCMGTHTYRTADMDTGGGIDVSYFYGATLWLRIS